MSFNFAISNNKQPFNGGKNFTLKELPVFELRMLLPIEKVFEKTTQICAVCNNSLTRVVTDLRPSCDDDGHYLGYYELGSFIACLSCDPKLRHRPIVPCAMWVHPRKRPRKKVAATGQAQVVNAALPSGQAVAQG